MTLKQALYRAREILTTNNIEDAPLESELLLRHTLGITRVQLYLNLGRELSSAQETAFWQVVKRRLGREPSPYILGCREFFGLDFCIDSSVLIPRPESELLVEKALEKAQKHTISTIAEIGTGCGAIAIALALNLPEVKIYATDISAPALSTALLNCQKHRVLDRICLLYGDLLAPLPGPVDLVVANLPYVKEADIDDGDYEPKLALDGGPDGLEKIRQLCCLAGDKLQPRGCLLLEIGQGQGNVVVSLLHRLFPSASLEIVPDLNGIERVVCLNLS